MKFSKYLMFILLCSITLLSACGEDENVDKVEASNNDDVADVTSDEVNDQLSEEIVKVEEIVDPYPKNALSAEVDIVMEEFNFVLTDFQLNLNDYFYGTVNSKIEDYQKKALLETGELVNAKMNIINLNAITEGDKEILYLYDELKKYHDIRFEALKTYLDNPNDDDFKVINNNSISASDIALKMIDIRAKDLE